MVREFGPDLIHCFNARVPVVAAGRAYSHASGAPVLVHWEDDEWLLRNGHPTSSWLRRAGRLGRRLASRFRPELWYMATAASLRWVERNAVAHDALTPRLAQYVEQRLGKPCVVIHPASPSSGAAAADAPDLPSTITSAPIATYTGQVHAARLEDFTLVLRAIAMVQRRRVRVSFVHAGGNVAGVSLETLAAEAGLAPDTYAFLGHLPFERIPPLLRESALLIASARPVPFNVMCLPSKLQAYLDSGRPVLALGPGAGELLRDREEVLKTWTGEPGELADRICEVLTDRSLAARLSTGGPRAAARLFDPVRNTDALLAHYRRTLAKSAG